MGALLSKKLTVCLSTIAILTSVVGCGDDTKSSTPSNTAGSGGSGGSGATGGSGGNTGGSGGSTGGSGGSTGGSAGTGGTVSPDGGVVCGIMTCTSPIPITPACCTANNTCGISLGGMCIEPVVPEAGPTLDAGPPGVPDPSCGTLPVFGFDLAGCCLPSNMCGYTSPIPGIGGCLSLTDLAMIPGIMLPEGGALSCVYPPP